MRILIAVHGYPPEQNGGAERRAERTARGLVARGHDVRVVCAAEDNQRSQGFRLHNGVPVLRCPLGPETDANDVRLEYDNPLIAAALGRLFAGWLPDVVHIFSGYRLSSSVATAALNYNIPVVVSLTDYWWLCHRLNLLRTDGRRCAGPTAVGCARCEAERRRRLRVPGAMFPRLADHVWNAAAALPVVKARIGVAEQAERKQSLVQTLNRTAALIAPSHYLAALYMRHGVRQDKLQVWRQGVELAYCPLRRPSSALRFGYIGQIKPHKGVDLLLRAWSGLEGQRARSLELYGSAVGAEGYARRIRSMLEGRTDAVWKGEFYGDQVWNVLAGLDVLVVPSRFAENSPNAVLEAQAVGLAVIGADLGGIGELVRHDQNGLLFQADDQADLKAQMQRLLDEPELLARLQAAPNAYRSLDEELEQLIALYARVRRPPTGRTLNAPE